MGLATSNSLLSPEKACDVPTKQYSMTFTGRLSFKTSKTKNKDSDSVYEKITDSPLWSEIVKEIMHRTVLEEGPPIYEILVSMDKDSRGMENCVRGVLSWKSVSLDVNEVANAIVDRVIDSLSDNVIRDDTSSWAFSFSPNGLEVD